MLIDGYNKLQLILLIVTIPTVIFTGC